MSINEEGFLQFVEEGLQGNKEGRWFVFTMNLLECITNLEMKVALIRRVNVVRREKGWSILNE